MPNSGQELSTFVQEEFENDDLLQAKLSDHTTSDRERDLINHTNSEMKKTIISEEKLTRILFGNILKWFQAERKRLEEAEAKLVANDNKNPFLTEDGLRQLTGRVPSISQPG